jgi:hypothetical protein
MISVLLETRYMLPMLNFILIDICKLCPSTGGKDSVSGVGQCKEDHNLESIVGWGN